MSQPVKSIFIVTKTEDPEAARLAGDIAGWLEARDVSCAIVQNREQEDKKNREDVARGAAKADLVLVLGGDGTMLSVIRKAGPDSAPLLGINFGKVGFLTDLDAAEWPETLSRILEQGFQVREMAAIDCQVFRGGGPEPVFTGRAVNDLVVNRGGLARLVAMEIYFNRERFGRLRADGLIVSTPMGSTGYGVSAGGPLVHPGVDGFCVTPICPFLNAFNPIVLPGDGLLEVEIRQSTVEVLLTLDGQKGMKLIPGDRIKAAKSARGAAMVRFDSPSYLAKLRSRGFVRDEG